MTHDLILTREELAFIQSLYSQAGSPPEQASPARLEIGERLTQLLAQFDNFEQLVISLSAGNQQHSYALAISHDEHAMHVDISPAAERTNAGAQAPQAQSSHPQKPQRATRRQRELAC